MAQPLQLSKLNFSGLMVLKDACTSTSYLVLPALKQEFTSIKKPLHLLKLHFSTFLGPKHDSTTSTRPPQQLKQVYLIFPLLKQDSTSIAQPLQLWKLGFRTFMVLKHCCTISSTVKTALPDLPSTET